MNIVSDQGNVELLLAKLNAARERELIFIECMRTIIKNPRCSSSIGEAIDVLIAKLEAVNNEN